MANELNFVYLPGELVEAEIYANGFVQQGGGIAVIETVVGVSGFYVGTVPAAPPIVDGVYSVLFRDTGSNNIVGRGPLYWANNAEDRQAVESATDAFQQFIEGGRDIDFVGNDLLGWQRIERDTSGVELARYNLFDDSGSRIDEAVPTFLARAGMISAEVKL